MCVAKSCGRPRSILAAVFLLMSGLMTAGPQPAAAQHWSFDARRIALGSTRPVTNPASGMVPSRRPYRSFVLPFRLFQVLGDLDVYNPHSIDFDPIRAATNIASPLHYTFGEPPPSDYSTLLNDLLNFNLDITSYLAEIGIHITDLEELVGSGGSGTDTVSGASLGPIPRWSAFGPPVRTALSDTAGDSLLQGLQIDLARWNWDEDYVGEFLFSKHWGRTFLLHEGRNGVTHSAYVGAGPYVSFHSGADVRAAFSSYLGIGSIVRSIDERRVLPDVAGIRLEFGIANHTYTQLAAAITGGYRLRLPFPGGEASGRDGIYVAADYHYLHGFAYENVGVDFDVVIDSADFFLADYDPAGAAVGQIERLTSRGGRGFALDLGIALVVDRWDFGFGTTGLANRITWRDVRRGVLPLLESNLYDGFGAGVLDDIQSPGDLYPDRRVTTPRRYTADIGYHESTWSVLANYSRGFVGHSVHTGMEYRLPWAELRYGGIFKRDRWHPTGGLGFELSPGWHLDVAAFGTSINPQRARRLALAVSFRLE